MFLYVFLLCNLGQSSHCVISMFGYVIVCKYSGTMSSCRVIGQYIIMSLEYILDIEGIHVKRGQLGQFCVFRQHRVCVDGHV